MLLPLLQVPYQTARVTEFLRNSAFPCNRSYIIYAYQGKIWNLQSSVTLGLRATNLLPTLFNLELRIKFLSITLAGSLVLLLGGLTTEYQSFLTSHATMGILKQIVC
jgi:hypothetical protein